MYQYFQPNPRGNNALRCDCAIRAVAKFFDTSWEDALSRIFSWASMACSSSDDIITFKYGMKKEGYTYTSEKGSGTPRLTVREFCHAHPRGKFLLRTEKKHYATIVDGVVYDAWDSSEIKVNSYFS